MSPKMSQGYAAIALGRPYIDEAAFLAKKLRKQGESRPMALVIHPQDEAYARSLSLFADFILFKPEGAFWAAQKTDFEKYGVYPKLNWDAYAPYDETIVLDTDVLCVSNPDRIWPWLSQRPEPIVMLGNADNPAWHWGAIREVSAAFGKPVPETHSGFIYVRRDPFVRVFFDQLRQMYNDYDRYKCKRLFRGGIADEILFALTYAHFGLTPVSFDDNVAIMSFNFPPSVALPCFFQTEGNRVRRLANPIVFAHMFDKMGGPYFTALYQKIMSVD